jgi:hypothetical protein
MQNFREKRRNVPEGSIAPQLKKVRKNFNIPWLSQDSVAPSDGKE